MILNRDFSSLQSSGFTADETINTLSASIGFQFTLRRPLLEFEDDLIGNLDFSFNASGTLDDPIDLNGVIAFNYSLYGKLHSRVIPLEDSKRYMKILPRKFR